MVHRAVDAWVLVLAETVAALLNDHALIFAHVLLHLRLRVLLRLMVLFRIHLARVCFLLGPECFSASLAHRTTGCIARMQQHLVPKN